MGDPKRCRKKYETPRFPWRSDVLQAELKLLGAYGLRNKRELWRHRTMLSKFRSMAKSLIGKPLDERIELEEKLLSRLRKLGLLSEGAALDEALDLTIEDVLERRLQTIVFRKGLAKTVHQARQLISHGHIAIGGRRVRSPSYLVLREEEDEVTYAPKSPLLNVDHPLRSTVEGAEREAML